MRITPNQAFLHGTVRYEPDEEVDVEPELGRYFVAQGWADSEDADAAIPNDGAQEVALDIENIELGVTSEVEG